ncbi:hypothetical protein VIGAN_09174300, partial [Vigna angularis var. angularis]
MHLKVLGNWLELPSLLVKVQVLLIILCFRIVILCSVKLCMDILETNALVSFFLLYHIIGLSPPFGHNPTLANKFIDKTFGFKPKLLILIVSTKDTEVRPFLNGNVFFVYYLDC